LKINLFIPCFVDQLFPSVGISAVRIFEKLGHAVDFKESILCCGQPAFNAGYWEETRGIARRVLEGLAGSDPVVGRFIAPEAGGATGFSPGFQQR
jgi:L-lactate dehydrogenase complex protein LldE